MTEMQIVYIIINSGFDVECITKVSNEDLKKLIFLKKTKKIIDSFCCGSVKCFFCKCEKVNIKEVKILEKSDILINEKLISELFIVIKCFHN